MSKKCEPTPDALQREIDDLKREQVADRAQANATLAEWIRKLRESEERCNAKEAELERLRFEKRAADVKMWPLKNALHQVRDAAMSAGFSI